MAGDATAPVRLMRDRGMVGTVMPTKQKKCGVGDAELSTST
jgi:hypothetical protein